MSMLAEAGQIREELLPVIKGLERSEEGGAAGPGESGISDQMLLELSHLERAAFSLCVAAVGGEGRTWRRGRLPRALAFPVHAGPDA